MLRAELPVQRKSNLKRGWAEFILAAGFLADGVVDPAGAFFDLGEAAEIVAEELVGGDAVLEALEVGFQLGRRAGGKAIDDPSAFAGGLDHAALAQVGEMLGDLGLRKLEDILEVANAKRALGEQIDKAKPDGLAEALVDLDELHRLNICAYKYICKDEYMRRGCGSLSVLGRVEAGGILPSECAGLGRQQSSRGPGSEPGVDAVGYEFGGICAGGGGFIFLSDFNRGSFGVEGDDGEVVADEPSRAGQHEVSDGQGKA